MQQDIQNNEDVARILSNEWFDNGKLLHIAFRLRKGETYISVNRPAISSYQSDVEDFIKNHCDYQLMPDTYRRALLNVGKIRNIKVSVGDTSMFADVEVEPRNTKTLSHAGIFTKFQNKNVKEGQIIKTGVAEKEISADTLLLEIRCLLLKLCKIEQCNITK